MDDTTATCTELRNFKRLRAGIDTAPFLEEIARHDGQWLANPLRQMIPAHRETQTIFLREVVREAGVAELDTHGSRWSAQSTYFPRACGFLRDFAATQGGELARVFLVRLQPRGRVYRHVDLGEYYRCRDRYHLVLDSRQGSVLSSGDELVRMHDGELWWFDNKQPHYAINDGATWRVHVIFDLTRMGSSSR